MRRREGSTGNTDALMTTDCKHDWKRISRTVYRCELCLMEIIPLVFVLSEEDFKGLNIYGWKYYLIFEINAPCGGIRRTG